MYTWAAAGFLPEAKEIRNNIYAAIRNNIYAAIRRDKDDGFMV